jgi:hypothetical protein
MRFHKAVEITKPEADSIIGRCTPALSEVVVISRGERYFDVRAMTHAEVEAFIADLVRAEYAALQTQSARFC